MLVNLLSSEDKSIMKKWIQWYGIGHREYNTYCEKNAASIEYILRKWDNNKSEHLWDMLGKQFILEKKVSYQCPEGYIKEQIHESINYGDMNPFRKYIFDHIEEYYTYYSTGYRAVCKLFETNILYENRWKYSDCTLTFGDVKIDISYDTKVMKVLGKIAQVFHAEVLFEQFRIAHSQILNQKMLTGILCLSIHPFDFMTLSDNDYSWTSCMSWEDNGCYRTGTVECMNSPYLVVAYLKGEKPYRVDDQYWSGNKKWRELFMVHPKAICNIKAYPYQNDTLTRLVLEWIRELVALNLHWEVPYDSTTFSTNVNFSYSDNNHYKFDLYYDSMYNDFDTNNTCHHIIITQGWQKENEDFYYEEINLSGPNVCMCCGSEWECPQGSENQVFCFSCDSGICCDSCGAEICDEDEAYYVEGDRLCASCYEEQAGQCVISEEYFYRENLVEIYCLPVADNLSGGISGLYSCLVYKDFIKKNALNRDFNFSVDSFHESKNEIGDKIYYINMTECSNYALDEYFGLYSERERHKYVENYMQLIDQKSRLE